MRTHRTVTERLSRQLKRLRRERGWSLDELAGKSGISRATLSRIESASVSPTADGLGRLCAVYALPMSRLMMLIEDEFTGHVPLASQIEWEDPATGFTRRTVSPLSSALAAEVQECHLPPGTRIVLEAPPRPGPERHLILLDGALSLTHGEASHNLTAGDCLRYFSSGPTELQTGARRGARYLMVLV